MAITFRPAARENVGLIIGMFGASGSGKTYSSMRLASGLSKGKPFVVIDTESRRALHYADMFKFDHGEIHAPFRPDTYVEAILAADKAGYPVIVVDSCSHEWAGEGGILDWQEDELDRMAGDDYRKREACKMAAWIKPKMSHKQMVQRLLQVKAHLILCFRAEEKSGMEKDKNGKTVIVQKGWQPICEKNMPYELTMSFMLTPDAPGMPNPVKLQEQHKAAIKLDKPIDENAGKLLAAWAEGKKPEPKETPKQSAPQAATPVASPEPKPHARGTITGDADEGDLSMIPSIPKADIDKMLAAFAKIGMDSAAVEREYNKPLASWTVEDLTEARAVFKECKQDWDLKQAAEKSTQDDVI